MAEEHGVAGGPAHHAQHRQPHVRQGLRGEPGKVHWRACPVSMSTQSIDQHLEGIKK